ncbi:MAG: hypothetical protein RR342_01335 [Bacilli bacterium]
MKNIKVGDKGYIIIGELIEPCTLYRFLNIEPVVVKSIYKTVDGNERYTLDNGNVVEEKDLYPENFFDNYKVIISKPADIIRERKSK